MKYLKFIISKKYRQEYKKFYSADIARKMQDYAEDITNIYA